MRISGFSSSRIDGAQCMGDSDASLCKIFRTAGSQADRQGEHGVDASCHGGSGPVIHAEKSRFPALDKIRTHDGDHMIVSHSVLQDPHLTEVAIVKWIVFCYDSCDLHGFDFSLKVRLFQAIYTDDGGIKRLWTDRQETIDGRQISGKPSG